MPEFRKNTAEQRYEILESSQVVGHITYEAAAEGVVDLTHTEIDPSQQGKGLGGLLVGYALGDIRALGARAIPTCTFIAKYMDEHPEVASLRAP
ncbi:MAG: GNAT family N-acetyltransferase [Ottowia sp.]|uniref:GNAT family N-acetyltransferase n=1 Tax=unclassified Ottowia TaxID=2645081 RepID=UPI003C30C2A1